MPAVNPDVAAVVEPPVAEAKSWVSGRTFRADRPLLDCSQAVPSYAPAAELREHLARVVLRPDAARYAPALGLPEAREAIAAHLSAAYGAPVAADEVIVTTGCNQAFCLAIDALARPGDEVVLPVPFYFNHDMWLRARGITPRYLVLDPTRGLEPDPDAVAAALGPSTTAIVLVTPNNPAGVTYSPAMIEACFALARDRGIALVVDETYRDFRATRDAPHGLFAESGWSDTLVQLSSFSKVFSLAGYRVGALVSSPDFVRETAKLADCMTIGAPRIGQEAVVFGLAHLDAWVERKRLEMLARVDAFRTGLAASRAPYQLLAAGAYFAYLCHPFGSEPAIRVARRLADEHDLLCIPGEAFGPGQEHCLRLAFGNVELDEIPEVAARLTASVR